MCIIFVYVVVDIICTCACLVRDRLKISACIRVWVCLSVCLYVRLSVYICQRHFCASFASAFACLHHFCIFPCILQLHNFCTEIIIKSWESCCKILWFNYMHTHIHTRMCIYAYVCAFRMSRSATQSVHRLFAYFFMQCVSVYVCICIGNAKLYIVNK